MAEEIELRPISSDNKPSITTRLACCMLPSMPAETCLVVSFSGVIDNSDPYSGGYSYIHSMIGTGYTACNPATLILDLRGLAYTSGEPMCKVIDQRIITKVVVSELNRQGLTNLLNTLLFLDPRSELFESLPEALDACDRGYRQFLRDGRKRTIAADF